MLRLNNTPIFIFAAVPHHSRTAKIASSRDLFHQSWRCSQQRRTISPLSCHYTLLWTSTLSRTRLGLFHILLLKHSHYYFMDTISLRRSDIFVQLTRMHHLWRVTLWSRIKDIWFIELLINIQDLCYLQRLHTCRIYSGLIRNCENCRRWRWFRQLCARLHFLE